METKTDVERIEAAGSSDVRDPADSLKIALSGLCVITVIKRSSYFDATVRTRVPDGLSQRTRLNEVRRRCLLRTHCGINLVTTCDSLVNKTVALLRSSLAYSMMRCITSHLRAGLLALGAEEHQHAHDQQGHPYMTRGIELIFNKSE